MVVPNVLGPRDLVFRPDNMDETVPHSIYYQVFNQKILKSFCTPTSARNTPASTLGHLRIWKAFAAQNAHRENHASEFKR